MTNFKSAALFTVFGFLLASLTGSPQAAPDKTLGMAIMSAHVSSNGTLLGGAGVKNATLHPPWDDVYDVVFKRSIEGCTVVGTLVDMEHSNIQVPGQISVSSLSGNPKGVFVVTHSSNGTQSPKSFHLMVFCRK